MAATRVGGFHGRALPYLFCSSLTVLHLDELHLLISCSPGGEGWRRSYGAFACFFLCLVVSYKRTAERQFKGANVDKTGHLDSHYGGGGGGRSARLRRRVPLARESYDMPLV